MLPEEYVTRAEMENALHLHQDKIDRVIANEREQRVADFSRLSNRVDDIHQSLTNISLGMQEVGRLTQSVNDLRRDIRGDGADGPDTVWKSLHRLQQDTGNILKGVEENRSWIKREMEIRYFRTRVASAVIQTLVGRWRFFGMVFMGILSLIVALIAGR